MTAKPNQSGAANAPKLSQSVLPHGQRHLLRVADLVSLCIATRTMKAILLFLFFTSCALAETPIVFQTLPIGDSIHVTFITDGCFHRATYEFDFHHAVSTTVKITESERHWDQASNREVATKPTVLGTIDLSKAELASLDRLMAFYRGAHAEGCTTTDHITVTQKRGDAVKATESFTDESCATYTMKDATIFPLLVMRLKPNTK